MKIYTDGASRGNPGQAAGGMVVGEHKEGVCFGIATNNVAEYKALQYALHVAVNRGAKEVDIFSDSRLMVEQINGKWLTNNPVLTEYRDDIRHYLEQHFFRSWTLTHIPREENTEADRLANEALDTECEK